MSADAAAAERALATVLLEEFPDDAAACLESAGDAESAALLADLSHDAAVTVMRRLTPDRAAGIVAALPAQTAREVLASLNPNRAAAFLARLDPEERERVLGALDARTAAELRELVGWPPESAGALMDPRVTTFRPDATAGEVVRRLRDFRERPLDEVFLVTADARLAGAVALQELLLADPDERMEGMAREFPVHVRATATREEVVETFEGHRVRSLPVVDVDGRLLGVLRQRELIEASRDQATASAVTMVGASEHERALSPPTFAVRKRLPWLQVNLATAFLAAAVVGLFEGTIARVTALAVLLPVVAGQSGNTGAQALAVTMRGLALREVRTRHWLRVAAKETLAGAGNGVAVAATTAAAVYWWSDSSGLALVIGLSMVLSMTLAGLSGALIPMLLVALGQDPAQSSSIILTTVTDVVGFFSFLGIATLLSSML